MSDIAINKATHDLVFVDNQIQFVTGAEYVVQRLRIRLDIQVGEWFLDLDEGLPYKDSIFVRNPNLIVIGAFLRTRISSMPEVESIDSFSLVFTRTTGYLKLDFQVTTLLGVVVAHAEEEDIISVLSSLMITPVGGII